MCRREIIVFSTSISSAVLTTGLGIHGDGQQDPVYAGGFFTEIYDLLTPGPAVPFW